MATGWSLDFCLACDRQTLGVGAYCSQYCRLAELDLTEEAIVIDTPVSVYPQRTQRTTTEIAAKIPRVSTVNDHIGDSFLPSNRSFTPWMISPSSSQTSLSSLKSHLSQDPTISDRVQDQLRDYASCFDQVRDLRRQLAS
ncbi:hypothetical protein BDV34DRAFT_206430 [Aspergillus parasiticus]|uniref:Uncharacterized protein n=1 Tax=Aspergillus parasiticus TaxID=5067 RepID=A0A5N6D3D8_ASPPA|nr:hypothetical protein BDV34DRAFT_206430 [Aspergillus parasiticus]